MSMLSDPFSLLQQMAEDMDRLFDHFGFGATGLTPQRSAQASRGGQQLARSGSQLWAPQLEVFRRGNELVVRADLPGMRREDVQIEIDDDVLTISGERRQENEENREGFFRSERSYGQFYRSIPLPENVDASNVSASFNDGVLDITIPMPQAEQRRPTRVEIR